MSSICAGGVFGLILVVGAIILVIFLQKRKKQKQKQRSNGRTENQGLELQPLSQPQPQPQQQQQQQQEQQQQQQQQQQPKTYAITQPESQSLQSEVKVHLTPESTFSSVEARQSQQSQQPQGTDKRGSSIFLMKTLVPTKPDGHRPSTIDPTQNAYLPTESIHDKPLEESESLL
jgi:apolipoprotein N-acyltransferase